MIPPRWRMLIYATILFVAGLITGASVASHTSAGSQTLKLGRSAEIAQMMKERLMALDLSSEQLKKLDPLITRTAEELEASHADCLKRISAAVDAMHQQMQADLTPEQKTKLQALEQQRRAAMQKKYNYPQPPAVPAHP